MRSDEVRSLEHSPLYPSLVESLDAAVEFFSDLGLELEGRATIEGEWAGRLTGTTPSTEFASAVRNLSATSFNTKMSIGSATSAVQRGILIGLAEDLR